MSPRTRFREDELRELARLRTTAQAAARLPHIQPWGWSGGLVDAHAVVACYPGLRVDAQWRLASYHHRAPEGCGAMLWALPAEATPPDPTSWNDRHHLADRPPPPTGACADFMVAIAGEPEPWTYLCASLLQRELEELGGLGAYRKWGKHELVWTNPWRFLTPAQRRENERHFTEGQYWLEDMLDDLSPVVEQRRDEVLVRFYTTRRKYHMPVYVHEDRYGADGFELSAGRRLVGRVPLHKPAWAGPLDAHVSIHDLQ